MSLETVHDQLVAGVLTGSATDGDRFIGRLRGAERRLAEIREVVADTRVALVSTAFDAYKEALRTASSERLLTDPPSGDTRVTGLEGAFSALHDSIGALKERARTLNRRRTIAAASITMLGSWAGALVITTQLLSSFGRNLGVELQARMPEIVREWVGNPESRERQMLGEPEACNDDDWQPIRSRGLDDGSRECRAWRVVAWRALDNGLVLVPRVSPSGRIWNTYGRAERRADEGRLRFSPFMDQPSQLRGQCVYRIQPGDAVRFVVWVERGASIISAMAVRVAPQNDESQFCTNAPQ